jgi:hypothetical protein
VLVLIERLVEIPVRIGILIGRTGCPLGRPNRFVTKMGEIAILQIDLTFFDEVALQLWLRLTGEESAAWSLVVTPLDEMDWGVRITEEVRFTRDVLSRCGRNLDRWIRICRIILVI